MRAGPACEGVHVLRRRLADNSSHDATPIHIDRAIHWSLILGRWNSSIRSDFGCQTCQSAILKGLAGGSDHIVCLGHSLSVVKGPGNGVEERLVLLHSNVKFLGSTLQGTLDLGTDFESENQILLIYLGCASNRTGEDKELAGSCCC